MLQRSVRNRIFILQVRKQFPGKQALRRSDDVHGWVQGLSKELRKRLLNDQTQVELSLR